MSDPFEIFDSFDGFGGAEAPGPPESGGAPDADGGDERVRPVRRWTSRSASHPAPRTPAAPAAAPNAPVADAPVADAPAPRVAPPATDPIDSDLPAFRALVLPELRAAVRHLVARGHHADLVEGSADDEPGVVVRFRVDPGPFAVRATVAARFEVRLGTDLGGHTQVVAGLTGAALGASFMLLERTPFRAVDHEWIRRQFVEFVQRSLAEQV